MTSPLGEAPYHAPASGGKARQLVVLLHGLGADGFDLIALAPILGRALPDAAFVSPHAPQPCDMAPMGRQWFSLQQTDEASLEAGVREAAPILSSFLKVEMGRHGLSESETALVGFSQGTMTGLYTALRHDRPLVGVVGFSGALIAPRRLTEEIRSRPPVLLVHGDADMVVPFAAMETAAQALAAARVPVRAERRPGLGHGIDEVGLGLAVGHLKSAFEGAENAVSGAG